MGPPLPIAGSVPGLNISNASTQSARLERVAVADFVHLWLIIVLSDYRDPIYQRTWLVSWAASRPVKQRGLSYRAKCL